MLKTVAISMLLTLLKNAAWNLVLNWTMIELDKIILQLKNHLLNSQGLIWKRMSRNDM